MIITNTTQEIQQYVIGGAVRDIILGRAPKDIDYVWVGSTPDHMRCLGMQCVGSAFPVFLDVEGNEHALARTEKKVGDGYNGFECTFDPSITLSDDQTRRDLTINQLAVKIEDWEEFKITINQSLIIDQFGGIKDLQQGILRHISQSFCEDPIRVLRTARFAARYGFKIANDTITLMNNLVTSGELNHLVAERVWIEFTRAMSEPNPHQFFFSLSRCAALSVLFPELGTAVLDACSKLHTSAKHQVGTTTNILVALHMVDNISINKFLVRLKSPTNINRLCAKLNTTLNILNRSQFTANNVFELCQQLDVFGNTNDLDIITQSVVVVGDNIQQKWDVVLAAIILAQEVSFSSLTTDQRNNLKGPEIKKALDVLRMDCILEVMSDQQLK